MLGHGLAPEHAPDPEGARRLLAEAGHIDGRDLPRLTFLAITQKPSKKTNGYWLAAQMRNKLGLDIELHQLPLPELMSRLEDGRPDLLYLAWGADYPDADSVLRGPGWPEACNWSNDQFAELVEDARTETNQAARFSLYRQAEELLAREAPLVPLSHFRWQILIQPWVQRFATSPAVWTILRDVVLDDENREVSERLRIEG
jgi:oligopeptide transport system substrate-binding protein